MHQFGPARSENATLYRFIDTDVNRIIKNPCIAYFYQERSRINNNNVFFRKQMEGQLMSAIGTFQNF